MKLNIQVPQKHRKNLKIILNQGIIKGYCCKQSCNDCSFKSFDTEKSIQITDLDKTKCNNCDQGSPIFSLKVELSGIEELLII